MCDVKIFAFRAEFEYFQGYILGCPISFTFETEIKKSTKISIISVWALNDVELDDLVERAQAKSAKYATNYVVSVFKGNLSVKILM